MKNNKDDIKMWIASAVCALLTLAIFTRLMLVAVH